MVKSRVAMHCMSSAVLKSTSFPAARLRTWNVLKVFGITVAAESKIGIKS